MSQRTVRSIVSCEGIGVHTGLPIKLEIHPAPENTGIIFERTDISAPSTKIPAIWDHATDTKMCTKIDNHQGASISTIEHVMAAFYACSVDNCIVKVNGPEVPIMDGSAAPFIFLMECAGYTLQDAPRQYLRITQPIRIEIDEKRWIFLEPTYDHCLSVDFKFDFAGRGDLSCQSAVFSGSPEQFKSAFAFARTFGFVSDLEKLQAMGLAKGSSLENSVGINADGILAKNGLRYQDEFVRHKILDCIGDLYTAGFPILAHVNAYNSGHHINNLVLKAVFENQDAFEIVTLENMQKPQRARNSSHSHPIPAATALA